MRPTWALLAFSAVAASAGGYAVARWSAADPPACPPYACPEVASFEERVRACRSAFATEEGFGFCKGCEGHEMPAKTLDSCEALGVTVDPEPILTREAAMCVASAAGLPTGWAKPWSAGLGCDPGSKTLVWTVHSKTSVGDCWFEGHRIEIDAATGYPLREIAPVEVHGDCIGRSWHP